MGGVFGERNHLFILTACSRGAIKNLKNKIMAERTMVEMTPEEKAQFEAFQRQQERKAQMESKREQRKQLQAMTDEEVQKHGKSKK